MSSDSKSLFSNFDKDFQEKIIQALLVDKSWAAQFCEVLKPEYFEFSYLQKLADLYLSYQRKYKDFPSLKLLVNITREEMKSGIDGALREQIVSCIKRLRVNEDLSDLHYVKEKALEYCKRMALKKALLESTNLIEQSNYESVVSVIKKAINLGTDNSPGLDLSDDIETRYSVNARKTISTGIKELDDKRILNGGLGIGELGVVVAPSKQGKSHILVHYGSQALLKGYNVLHYTFELREPVIGIRYDSHLLDLSSTECPEHKEKISKFYKENNEKLGRLKIKYFPTSAITCNQLSAHMEKLSLEGFKPDLIIVDYLSIMRSSHKTDLLRQEIKYVAEELRAFAYECGVPIWTAAQSNREGAQSEVVDLTNVAESFGLVQVADVIIGLSRKKENKSSGIGTLYIAGNRAGIDGVQFAIHLDTSKSKVRILTDQEVSENNDVSKEALQNTLKTTAWSAYKRTQKNNDDELSLSGVNFQKVQ